MGCLLYLVVYIFALIILWAQVRDAHGFSGEYREARVRYFQDMSTTMLTLFQAVTGGIDWYLLTQALWEVSPWLSRFFVCYIGFVSFLFMNVVLGLFVEQASHAAKNDLDYLVQQEGRERAAITD